MQQCRSDAIANFLQKRHETVACHEGIVAGTVRTLLRLQIAFVVSLLRVRIARHVWQVSILIHLFHLLQIATILLTVQYEIDVVRPCASVLMWTPSSIAIADTNFQHVRILIQNQRFQIRFRFVKFVKMKANIWIFLVQRDLLDVYSLTVLIKKKKVIDETQLKSRIKFNNEESKKVLTPRKTYRSNTNV